MAGSLTNQNIEYIKANRLTMSGTDMAAVLGINKSVVNLYMRKNGLAVSKKLQQQFRSKALIGRTTFTAAEDQFIKDNYLLMPIKTLGDKIGRSYTGIMFRLKVFGFQIPQEVIQRNKDASRYQAGFTPANKGKKQTEYMSAAAIERTKATRFYKDHILHNAKEADGVISIRKSAKSAKAYQYIRLSLGEWQLLHRVLWEKENGAVPPGHCLWFIDGNTQNVTLENLQLITRAENARRNKTQFDQQHPEIKQSIRLINKINKKINHHG